MTQGVVPVFNPSTGASGGPAAGGGGDYRLDPDDSSGIKSGNNGALNTIGFTDGVGTSVSHVATLQDAPPTSALSSSSLTVVNTDRANPNVTFTPDVIGRYRVALTGTDANSNTSLASTQVQIKANPPQVVSPSNTTGGVGDGLITVTFTNVGGSVSSTSATLLRPEGSSASLGGSSPSLARTYTPDLPGNYAVAMSGTNSDGTGVIATNTRNVVLRAPTANAGSNQNSVSAGTVTLNGSGSSRHAQSGGTLLYLWTFLSTNTATLSSTTVHSPTFPGVAGASYTLNLRVTDNENNEVANDSVDVVMVGEVMPAASAVCNFRSDLTDISSLSAGATTSVYEDDGSTLKATVKHLAAGNSSGDVYKVTEAAGLYVRTKWSGSGSSVNRRFIVIPSFPGASLDWEGRIIVAVLMSIVTVDGSGSSNTSTVRISCGPSSTSTDYSSPPALAIMAQDKTSVVWKSGVYNGSSTISETAASTGNLTTNPAGGTMLVVFAFDAQNNIRVALGETALPSNVGDVTYDFESSAQAGGSPTTAAANPWAAGGGGLAVRFYVNNKSTASPGATIIACDAIKVWTD